MEFERGTSETDTQFSAYVITAVITAVIMRSAIFWDVLPCSRVEVHRCFGDIYYPHLHSLRVGHKKLYLPLLITDLLLAS
jgi:hypothetical protein